MLHLLRRNKADGVIVHKVDRSARNMHDWTDFADLVERGVAIHFAGESLDLNTRGGRLSADIQAVVASDFIRNLKNETKKGVYRRLRDGYLPWAAPLGYRNGGKGKHKTIDPRKGPLVRELFERYATGEYTQEELRVLMTARGLRNKVGKPLGQNAVPDILKNPFYAGITQIRKTGERFKGKHEPLIDLVLFNRVQDVISGRRRQKKHKHFFLYRKLFNCGRCNCVLTGELQKGHIYYRCHTRSCETKCVREERISDVTHDALRRISLTDSELESCDSILTSLATVHDSVTKNAVSNLKTAADTISDRLDRLTDMALDGVIDSDSYVAKKRQLIEKQGVLEATSQELEASPYWISEQVGKYFELARNAQQSFENANQHEQRKMVEMVTSNRTVTGKNVAVELRFPFQYFAESHSSPDRVHPRELLRTQTALGHELDPDIEVPFRPSRMSIMVLKVLLWLKTAQLAGDGK